MVFGLELACPGVFGDKTGVVVERNKGSVPFFVISEIRGQYPFL